MFHPIIFQIHIYSYTSYTIWMTIIQKGFKKNLSALSTIMEKVALPRGYFPAALVNITSGFL